MNSPSFILPDWPAPQHVRAVATTRLGGVSQSPYDSFNLATHVGDNAAYVQQNRQQLVAQLGLQHEPCWLQQVHSNRIIEATVSRDVIEADASFSRIPEQGCVVMTADCLPVLFCDRQGTVVAAAHAGWRGLADGILENTIAAMQVPETDVLAWLGPAIGPQVYEVGTNVYDVFMQQNSAAGLAFNVTRPGHWLMDIYQLARQRLQAVGMTHIYGGDYCTFSDNERFYSYRRDGVTGRMASLIWLQGESLD